MTFWKDVLTRVRTTTQAPFGVARAGSYLIKDDAKVHVNDSDDTIIAFFENTVGLQLEHQRVTNWKDIKKKSVRDSLLREYVFRHTTDTSNAAELESQLSSFHLDIGVKKIHHTDITIGEDGLIETISLG